MSTIPNFSSSACFEVDRKMLNPSDLTLTAICFHIARHGAASAPPPHDSLHLHSQADVCFLGELTSPHLSGLFCVPLCASACRRTSRPPLTLSVLRMCTWSHLHAVLHVMSVDPFTPPYLPLHAQLVSSDSIGWMEGAHHRGISSHLIDISSHKVHLEISRLTKANFR